AAVAVPELASLSECLRRPPLVPRAAPPILDEPAEAPAGPGLAPLAGLRVERHRPPVVVGDPSSLAQGLREPTAGVCAPEVAPVPEEQGGLLGVLRYPLPIREEHAERGAREALAAVAALLEMDGGFGGVRRGPSPEALHPAQIGAADGI